MMKVRGFHGTTNASATSLLNGDSFLLSQNEGDWLGSGIYFFQDAPERARWWAEQACGEGDTPAVLLAEIDLTDSLDLLDLWGFDEISYHYGEFSKGTNYPYQKPLELFDGKTRSPLAGTRLVDRNKRDCALIDYAVAAIEVKTGTIVPSVRSSFLWGKAVYKESFLFDWSNVQIAVRDPSAITKLGRYELS